jgi:glutamyl-tRNA synthetase
LATLASVDVNPEVPLVLDRGEIDVLFRADLPDPGYWEARFPPRQLPAAAEVTRLCPPPTGFAHIGGIYVAMLDKAIAHFTQALSLGARHER